MTSGRVERRPFPGGLSISESVSVRGPGKWTYVSGRIPLDETGEAHTGTFRDQTESVFDQLEAALAHAGASLTDVIKITVFLTDFGELRVVNDARAERFGDFVPASTAVEVSALYGGARLEIEAIAFTPGAADERR